MFRGSMANKAESVGALAPVAPVPAAPVAPSSQDSGSVKTNIILNIVSSVALVNVNKLLVTYGFTNILLLTACHFLTGYLFLHAISSERFNLGLFTRPSPLPLGVTLPIAAAGIGSIVLMNYSLQFNSVGTYQILKIAVLPATMILSLTQRISTPTLKQVLAAGLVVIGALVCTVSDVRMTLFGVLIGVAAVVATAQYQIYQQTVQSRHKINSTQALYSISLPQAIMTFCASILFETAWGERIYGPIGSSVKDDLWAHPYTVGEVLLILTTCALAVLLNYSTIAVIGKHSLRTIALLVGGLGVVFAGVILYSKSSTSNVPKPANNAVTATSTTK